MDRLSSVLSPFISVIRECTSEYIRGTIQAERFGVREVRLRQFGRVQRRDRGYMGG